MIHMRLPRIWHACMILMALLGVGIPVADAYNISGPVPPSEALPAWPGSSTLPQFRITLGSGGGCAIPGPNVAELPIATPDSGGLTAPTASTQPCQTFHGLCSQTAVAHYSMVNIAQRLDNLVKQLPSSTAPSACSTTAAAQKLANEMTDALISNDVYHSHAQVYLPSFVQRIPNNDTLALAVLGLTPNRLSDPATGFYASVYKDMYTGKYIVANRGTVISGWHPLISSHDLATDVRQALGYPTRQYNADATRLGKALAKVNGGNVVLTGHSLGGGLAALEAYITGDPAVTFDAAGLSAATKAQDNATKSAAVVNVDVNGEFLGQMQGHSLRHDFACALNSNPLTLPMRLETLVVLHGIADLYGLNYNQVMSPSTILPLAAGRQVMVPLTQWSSTTTNSESTVTPNIGTCLNQVIQEAVNYHAADKVVHALNYQLTQLICQGTQP